MKKNADTKRGDGLQLACKMPSMQRDFWFEQWFCHRSANARGVYDGFADEEADRKAILLGMPMICLISNIYIDIIILFYYGANSKPCWSLCRIEEDWASYGNKSGIE